MWDRRHLLGTFCLDYQSPTCPTIPRPRTPPHGVPLNQLCPRDPGTLGALQLAHLVPFVPGPLGGAGVLPPWVSPRPAGAAAAPAWEAGLPGVRVLASGMSWNSLHWAQGARGQCGQLLLELGACQFGARLSPRDSGA